MLSNFISDNKLAAKQQSKFKNTVTQLLEALDNHAKHSSKKLDLRVILPHWATSGGPPL
jgi:hypothetical protein